MHERMLLQDDGNAIIDRGRGPEIAGTRITVYHIHDYERMDWPNERTAKWLGISLSQVELARRFIREHRPEVMVECQKMLDRERQGNSPQAQAKVDAAHTRFLARLDEPRRRRLEELFGERTRGSNGFEWSGGGR